MTSLTFDLFTPGSDSGSHGSLIICYDFKCNTEGPQ